MATRQAGVISTRQLAGLGLRGKEVTRWVRQGRLHRWPGFRGIYTLSPRHLLPLPARVWAAYLLGGEGAVISHRTAAGWWSLLDGYPSPIDIALPGYRDDIAGVRFHRPRLDTSDRTVARDARVTTVHRTLLDLGHTHPHRLHKALANADFHHHLDFPTLERLIDRVSRHPGRSALREAMPLFHPGFARTRSRLEDDGLLIVLRANLPRPQVNALVCGFEADLWWPGHRLIVEWDGPRHRTPAGRRNDRRRDELHERAAITVERFSDDDVNHRPDRVATSIACLLDARR